jgi:hypothetical protein
VEARAYAGEGGIVKMSFSVLCGDVLVRFGVKGITPGEVWIMVQEVEAQQSS